MRRASTCCRGAPPGRGASCGALASVQSSPPPAFDGARQRAPPHRGAPGDVDPRSHIDSVPDGGWLDGCLGVLAGLEVVRTIAAGGRPPLTVQLVDWADEEGARFGLSLMGSSA